MVLKVSFPMKSAYYTALELSKPVRFDGIDFLLV